MCVITMLFVFVMALDRFNLLVEYDVWVERGMPNPFS